MLKTSIQSFDDDLHPNITIKEKSDNLKNIFSKPKMEKTEEKWKMELKKFSQAKKSQ